MRVLRVPEPFLGSDSSGTEKFTPREIPELVAKPSADFPEYWLGQLKTIDQQERGGLLTKAQMVSEVHRVMDEMRKWEVLKLNRARGFAVGFAQMA